MRVCLAFISLDLPVHALHLYVSVNMNMYTQVVCNETIVTVTVCDVLAYHFSCIHAMCVCYI